MPVAPPQTPVTIAAPPPPESPAPPQPPPKSHKKLFIFTALLIIFIFSSAVGAFFLASQQQNLFAPEESPTPIPMVTPQPVPTVEPIMQPFTPIPTSVGTTSTSGETQTKTITSLPTLDGFLGSNGTANKSQDLRAGRDPYAIFRSFVSFDLSSIPKNTNVESATLRLYQTDTEGNPYVAGGNLMIDHVDYGNSLEGEDYTLPPLATGIATLTTNGNVEWKEVEVAEAVRSDLANLRLRTGIRIRFTTEKIGGQGNGDTASFEAAENSSGTGNVPQLIIKYK